ncbi:MAG: HAMP domain-containing histidine kinase [Lachnospiraceae bacterium]|nr:HAMP domain-containing histidine kinase [Lachnospiraceae bacterium]
MRTRPKRHLFKSIQQQYVLMVVLAILGTLLVCWLFNAYFSERVYQKSKMNSVRSVYEKIVQNYQRLDTDENAALELEKLAVSEDVSPYIFQVYQNNSTYFLVSIYPNISRSERQLLFQRVSGYLIDYLGYSTEDVYQNGKEGPSADKDKEEIERGSSYGIYHVLDRRTESQFLELFGALDDDTMVLVRCNYESVQETVMVFNRLLAEIGIVAMIVSALITYFITMGVTKPVRRLTEIAEKMSDLDFDVKYTGDTGTEVDRLGHSINVLSERLEETISELKGANNELRRDIERRTQMDSMRTEFLSNVSHELKTPIALIQGYAEGLKDNISSDEESREFYCDVIIDESGKMNEMVKKLITLNEMEFGQSQIEFARFDITALIRSILNAKKLLLRQKDAHVVFEPAEPVMVWADEFMVEEVFTNYLTNAVNHLDGERRIEIQVEQRQNLVRVSVSNTGEQIPEEEQEKIWDKFYKVDKARTREYGGSGIGLSIVRAVMDGLHQDYGVYNREDGVTFWFELDGGFRVAEEEGAPAGEPEND